MLLNQVNPAVLFSSGLLFPIPGVVQSIAETFGLWLNKFPARLLSFFNMFVDQDVSKEASDQ